MSKILFRNARIITADASMRVIPNGYLLVRDDRIASLGEGEPPETGNVDQVIDCQGNLLMPGFIDTHTHLPMSMMRGYADDLPLHEWIEKKTGPMLEKDTYDTMYLSTTLGLMEMLRNGITCVNEMYPSIRAALDASSAVGIRGLFSMGISGPLADCRERLRENLSVMEEYAENPLLHVGFAAHAEYSCETEFLRLVSDTAAERGSFIHIHCSETQKEHEECKQRHGGLTPIRFFDSLGFFRSRVLLAHCVWVDEEDLDVLAARNGHVLHNPSSNLKLASGIAPLGRMLDKGISVGLATDSCVSNNRLDLWEEMRLAALLGKVRADNASAVPAQTAFRLATAGGAAALGLTDVGCLAPGMKADLIQVNTVGNPHYCPESDLFSRIVYSGCASDVTMTMVNGRILYRGGEYTTIDSERTLALCTRLASALYGDV